jgi:flagellar protein FliO/FliZ
VETLVVALRVVLSLAVVLGLLWVMQRRLTRGARASHTPNLVTVVGRQGVGQKASVVVVDIDGKRFVLGVTEQSVNVLHGGDVPAPSAAAAVFARSLAEAGVAEAGVAETAPVHLVRPRRDRGPAIGMGGSILSVETWRQTAAALRQKR